MVGSGCRHRIWPHVTDGAPEADQPTCAKAPLSSLWCPAGPGTAGAACYLGGLLAIGCWALRFCCYLLLGWSVGPGATGACYLGALLVLRFCCCVLLAVCQLGALLGMVPLVLLAICCLLLGCPAGLASHVRLGAALLVLLAISSSGLFVFVLPCPLTFPWQAMTFTEPGAPCQSELEVEGRYGFGAACEAKRDSALGMALSPQLPLIDSLTYSLINRASVQIIAKSWQNISRGLRKAAVANLPSGHFAIFKDHPTLVDPRDTQDSPGRGCSGLHRC